MSDTISISKRALRLGGVLAAGAALLGIAAIASAQPVTPGIIQGCVNNQNQRVRIVTGAQQCVTTGEQSARETAVNWNAQGPKGDKGDTGATGPQGPAGANAAVKPVVRERQQDLLANVIGEVTAPCNAGEVATGGGYIAQGATFGTTHVGVSGPLPSTPGSTPNRWQVIAFNPSNNFSVTVWVICVPG